MANQRWTEGLIKNYGEVSTGGSVTMLLPLLTDYNTLTG